jgi:hypothetical protein
MLKQLPIIFAIATILFACKPPDGEKKYTKHEWDSITKAQHEHEFDSVLLAYKKTNPDLDMPRKNKGPYYNGYQITQSTFTPYPDSLTIEERTLPAHCYPTYILYIYNKKMSGIVYLGGKDDFNNKYFERDLNYILKQIRLIDRGNGLDFIDLIMTNHFSAIKLKKSDTTSVKNTAEDYTGKLSGEYTKECRESVMKNSKTVINILKTKDWNTTVYESFIFYYVIKHKKNEDGHYSIEFKDIVPKNCPLYFCI